MRNQQDDSLPPLEGEYESDKSVFNSHKYSGKQQRQKIIQTILKWLGTGEIEPAMITLSYPSFFGKVRRLISFNQEKMRHFIAIFSSSDLTVFNSFSRWFYNLGWIVYALIIMFSFSFLYFPDGKFEERTDPCAGVKNENVCGLYKLLLDARSDFRYLISFLLAGFIAVSLASWQAKRKSYATCLANCRNLIILFVTNIPKDQIVHIRKLNRWLRLAFELAILDVRGNSDSDEAYEFLVYEKLLEPGEWRYMAPGERIVSVILWISRELDCLKMECNIENYTSLTNALSQYRGVDWSIWYYQYGEKFFTSDGIEIYVDIVILFMWNISYIAVFDLGHTLSNPFLDRRIDLPHEKISDELINFESMITSDIQKYTPSTSLIASNRTQSIRNMCSNV